MSHDLPSTARALVARGRGILAADESNATVGKQFAAHGIPCTPESRRAYREALFTTAEWGLLSPPWGGGGDGPLARKDGSLARV